MDRTLLWWTLLATRIQCQEQKKNTNLVNIFSRTNQNILTKKRKKAWHIQDKKKSYSRESINFYQQGWNIYSSLKWLLCPRIITKKINYVMKFLCHNSEIEQQRICSFLDHARLAETTEIVKNQKREKNYPTASWPKILGKQPRGTFNEQTVNFLFGHKRNPRNIAEQYKIQYW